MADFALGIEKSILQKFSRIIQNYMKSRNIVILAVILFTCSRNRETTSSDSAAISGQTEFETFVNLLPAIKLPVIINCESCCDLPTLDTENPIVQKYAPQGASLYGVVFRNDTHIGILTTFPADMIIPTLRVYNLQGKQLDEMNFLTGWCGREPEFFQSQNFQVTADYIFSEIDSTYTFEMDSTMEEILDTIKTEFTRTDYYVNNEGKIVKR